MGELITLQVGQCGNQVGSEFWKKIAEEHGIGKDGCLEREVPQDRKDVFFYHSNAGKYVPRVVMMDLEPRVINSIVQGRREFYNRENIFLGNEGGGAGNIWAHGYRRGTESKEDIFDIIQREAECSEYLDGFILFHSIGGGTGSGMGSYLLEEIRDVFGWKKKVQAISIFPNNEEVSDVVVQPYNSVLTLSWLSKYADSVIAMDNSALERVTRGNSGEKISRIEHTNHLVSTVASSATVTFRFPGSRFSDIFSMVAACIPIPKCHFVIPSYTSFTAEDLGGMRRASCFDVQRRLLLPKTRLATYEESAGNLFLSAVSVITGFSAKEIQGGTMKLKERGMLRFAPSVFSSIQASIGKEREDREKSGLLLGNNTGFSKALNKICLQFDRFRKKNAFLSVFRKEGIFNDVDTEFSEARNTVQETIDEYISSEGRNFPNEPK